MSDPFMMLRPLYKMVGNDLVAPKRTHIKVKDATPYPAVYIDGIGLVDKPF